MLRVPSLVLLMIFAAATQADEKLKGIACRSVHLGYPSGEVSAFATEVIVKQSAPGSYFMACGWDKGYFGIQEQGPGKKVVIFSVWDSGDNDKTKLDPELRVKVLHKGEGVSIGRFGGEGSGGQSFLDFDWKLDAPYRFQVTAKKADDKRTEYAGWFRTPDDQEWRHMVTFSTVTGGKAGMKGLYSFVEDFKRDRVSTTKTRRAEFGPGWAQPIGGEWTPLLKARFTADANPVLNIDAGLVKGTDRYFLATGGEVAITGPNLREVMELPAGERKAPADLPK